MRQLMQREIHKNQELIHSFIKKILNTIVPYRRIPKDLILKLCQFLYVSPYRKYSLYLPVHSSTQSIIFLQNREKSSENKLLVETGNRVILLETISLWKGINNNPKAANKYWSPFIQFFGKLRNKATTIYCKNQNLQFTTLLIEARQRFSLEFQDQILEYMKKNYLVLTHQSKILLFVNDKEHQIKGTDIVVVYNNVNNKWEISTKSGTVWKRPKYINRQRNLVRLEVSSKLCCDSIFQIEGPFCLEANHFTIN